MTTCTQNCACAEPTVTQGVCALPTTPVSFDREGKCPCGKTADMCCHGGEAQSGANDAIGELCAPHNGQNVCS